MELAIARQIIDTLAQGIHPVTGEAMPEDSPYNAAPVIRALHKVSCALDGPAPVNATGAMWVAAVQGTHFAFSGAGATKKDAERALRKSLQKHADEYTLKGDWIDLMAKRANTVAFKLGEGYRDGEANTF